MKTVIVEDNISIQRTMVIMLKEYCPQIVLKGIAGTISEAEKLITIHEPDLLLLDVELPDGKGFDVLKNNDSLDLQVIFITAHEQYALSAIKFSALDFLLKPIDQEEFITAIQKAEKSINKSIALKKLEVLLENISSDPSPKKLVLTDKYGVQVVLVNDIIRLEAKGSYTEFIISGNTSRVVSKGLKEFEDILPTTTFFRSHQSHLVNLDYLARYDRRDGDVLQLKNGENIPLAVRKKDKLLNLLKSI